MMKNDGVVNYHHSHCYRNCLCLGLLYLIIFGHLCQPAMGNVTPITSMTSIVMPIDTEKIQERVVIPVSTDLEKETNELYEKALREYGVTVSDTRKICSNWKAIGCQCGDKDDDYINLTCRSIDIESILKIPWPSNLVKLEISNNNITNLTSKSFELPHLKELVLSHNSIQTIEPDTFSNLNELKALSITHCGLQAIQKNNFKHLNKLNTLNLANNQVKEISAGDFPVMKYLTLLSLKRNHLTEIPSGTLLSMNSLEIIDLDDNLLLHLPPDLVKLSRLQKLYASGNRIKFIAANSLPKSLQIIELRSNPLQSFDKSAIHNMTTLIKLTLSDSKRLQELPEFDGCKSLEILSVDRGKLNTLPSSLCQNSPRLKSLNVKSNMLRVIPSLKDCKNLRMLDLAGNRIDTLHDTPFRGLNLLEDLLLSYNEIATIPFDAFHGLLSIELLDLEGNNINFIHKDAFKFFTKIKDLNLGNNIFPELPIDGLKSLNHIKTFNNPKLREFPAPKSFPKIQTLVLSYAYHCCAFIPLKVKPSDSFQTSLTDEIIIVPPGTDLSPWYNKSFHNYTNKFSQDFWGFPQDYGSIPTYPEYNEDSFSTKSTDLDTIPSSIHCLPLPDPFLPCQDLFDWWTLRCGVWVVFLLAMLGNGTVVFVLIFSRSKMDVPRFLVCNLAAADFFMGIYLGLLAVVDASTLGEFRMYAITWQMSVGCQLAGFLAVLSSELSVYTLAVITLERNYAITHAMHLNKRLSLRHAGYIMTIGWIFALTMAVLPLLGISDYRKFAVCLPFETTTGPGSLAYVIFLMFINGVAFLILMGCYLKMYCAIRGSQAWNSNDSRIAKRMALLVFTDFICWSPIAFFSLTAVFGLHLVSLEQAKVFTVFVLPLNSCCNPFLYAILTKQFKKDCVLICKAIEESRVTRGIGRCRHSSNFSNRQTPANTNSLVERSSRDMLPPLLPGGCACAKLLDQDTVRRHSTKQNQSALAKAWRNLFCHKRRTETRRGKRSDQYAHQIAEIQQKNHKRAGSMSSSENFSSSRSDSWRHGPPHHYCGIQLRKLDPRWRHSSWLITRKTSQDSNLSSSRNDSSGSNTTQTTSTFRLSRSSAGASITLPQLGNSFTSSISRQSIPGNKPRLVRQSAITDDYGHDSSCSPRRLSVRFLPTIPSAADSSVQLDDETSTQANDSGNNSGAEGAVGGATVVTVAVPASNSGTIAGTSVNSHSCNSLNLSSNNNNNNNGGAQYYAVLQSGNPQTTLSSPKDKSKPP